MTSKRKKFWGNNPKYKQPKTTNDSTANRFQVLSDLEESEMSSEEGEFKEYSVKVPPIVVDSCHNFASVIKLLGTNCKYKRMSIGTKVMPNSMSIYEDILKLLKEKDLKFYTHPVKDQKKFKLILFGLPQIDIKTIQEEFKQTFNIEPISINEVITKRSNSDDAIFMMEFNRNQVSKKEIIRIKYFYGIAVHWRNPLRRSKGPSQCSKCTMFGHGSANCYRKSICTGCGGPHDYASCQLNKTSFEGPVVYKCFNCVKKNLKNVNHRADDIRCPSRREYLEIRQKVTQNQRQQQSQNKRTEVNFSSEDFPPINNTIHIPNSSWPHNHIETNNSIPQAYTSSYTRRNFQNDVSSPRRNYQNEDDLTNEKLLEIYFEALDALEKCKTKFDKMRVLGNMLRHVI